MLQEREIIIDRKVTQKSEGREYEAELKFGETTLNCIVKFAVPIPELDDITEEQAKDPRSVIQIEVKKGDKQIELAYPEEYGFFFKLLAPSIVGFHDDPLTRAHNKSFKKSALPEHFAALGGWLKLSFSDSLNVQPTPELVEFLSSPKFELIDK